MIRKRLIPGLLLSEGRLVKGVCFRDLKDAGSPHTTARAYNAQGADELFLLDIKASRECREPDFDTIGRVARESFMPLTVGGGVVSVDVALACMKNGADKVCVTTAALDRPHLIEELSRTFGRQAIVLGVDVMTDSDGSRCLYDHRIASPIDGLDWRAWLRNGVARGAGEVRLMSVGCEGGRQGLDLDLFREARGLVDVPIVLEGGAGTIAHVGAAYGAGVEAVAIGTMLVFADNNIIQVKRHLANENHAMRL